MDFGLYLWLSGGAAAAILASIVFVLLVRRRVAHAPRALRLQALWLAGAIPPIGVLSAACGCVLYLLAGEIYGHAGDREGPVRSAPIGGGYEIYVWGSPEEADVMRPSGDGLGGGVRRVGVDERWILIDYGNDRHTLIDKDADEIAERISRAELDARFAALAITPPVLQAPAVVLEAQPRFRAELLALAVGCLPPAMLGIWLLVLLRRATSLARCASIAVIPA